MTDLPAVMRNRRGRRRLNPARSHLRLVGFDRALETPLVAGADEAGRGCLAGPLVMAAVLLDYERIGPREVRLLAGLNDSKQQSEAAREELYPRVLRVAARAAIITRSSETIDRAGLHKSNLAGLATALRRVTADARGREVTCLVDGFRVGDLGHRQHAVIDGDERSAAIAAASILAKVTRDRLMRRLDAIHPGWAFARHVGYATPEHREAIGRLGISPLHRRSFQSIAYQQLELE